MQLKKYTIPIFLIITSLLTGALAAEFLRTIPHNGYIRAIGVRVYDDALCTSETTTIDWGELEPSFVYYSVKYIKNTQTVDVELTISALNWNPIEAGTYLTVEWNYTGAVLAPNFVEPVQIALIVDPAIEGIADWTGDIRIAAIESGAP